MRCLSKQRKSWFYLKPVAKEGQTLLTNKINYLLYHLKKSFRLLLWAASCFLIRRQVPLKFFIKVVKYKDNLNISIILTTKSKNTLQVNSKLVLTVQVEVKSSLLLKRKQNFWNFILTFSRTDHNSSFSLFAWFYRNYMYFVTSNKNTLLTNLLFWEFVEMK